MNVVLFGATGMVGHGVLLECLEATDVERVLAVVRRPADVEHSKLQYLVHDNFTDFGAVESRLSGFDACFFCVGVTSTGMDEAAYREVTVDITVAAATVLLRRNPKMTVCFVSGARTNRDGRAMWARVKAEAEDRLLGMGFAQAVMFRPGFIRPMKGVKSKTALYRAFYAVLRPLDPLIARLPGLATTTEKVGQAMLNAVRKPGPSRVLESRDINALAG